MTTVCRTERVYRRKLAENLRRFSRSGSCGPGASRKKVQRYGSRQMKCCHLANVRSSPIADKLLQCRECPLCATSRHSKSDSRRTDPYSAGCAAPPRFVAPCSPDARAAKNVITAQASEQAARKYRPAWKLPVESLIQPTTKGPT